MSVCRYVGDVGDVGLGFADPTCMTNALVSQKEVLRRRGKGAHGYADCHYAATDELV